LFVGWRERLSRAGSQQLAWWRFGGAKAAAQPRPKLVTKTRPPAPELPTSGPIAQKALYVQGKSLLRKGLSRQAIDVFRRAIAAHSDPDRRANCYLGLGAALSDSGDKKGAVAAYRQVVALRPKDGAAYQVLAMGLSDVGDRAGAKEALSAASKLEPDRLSLYQDLISLQLEDKEVDAAQKAYLRYEKARKALIARLLRADEPASSRQQAAANLGMARDNQTAKALLTALDDRSLDVRLAVIRALGAQGIKSTMAVLRKRLDTAGPREKRAIQISLQAIENAPPPPPGPAADPGSSPKRKSPSPKQASKPASKRR
jgi:tetratricopeptide (TPR) repeat protein